MNEVTRVLSAIEEGDPQAAEQLWPLVYEELRRLAAQKLAQEKPGQTLEATALVHEAYLRLVDVDKAQHWNSRGHFFIAAAEAMRRILVENARRKKALRRGGGRQRQNLDLAEPAVPRRSDDLLALDEALEKLAAKDRAKAELVKLRYFAGLTMEQTAEALGISLATANRYWNYARARWPGASVFFLRWCSRTFPPTCSSLFCRSRRPSLLQSSCSSCVFRFRRWMCRRDSRTLRPWLPLTSVRLRQASLVLPAPQEQHSPQRLPGSSWPAPSWPACRSS